VVLRGTKEPLKIAYVYNNTIYTVGKGIYFGNRALIDDSVTGNLIFALTPVSGAIMRQSNNITEAVLNAPKYVRSPSFTGGPKDFYPLKGKCQGPPLDLSDFHSNTDYTLDFNGASKVQAKGASVFRGAYAGEEANPGWELQEGIKAAVPLPSLAPTLIWMDPAGGAAGRSATVTLTGTNFNDSVAVAFSGAGIKVTGITVKGPTRITATVAIAAGGSGPRQVTVSTPFGVSNALTFRVAPQAVRR
jgi:hypothetical protein